MPFEPVEPYPIDPDDTVTMGRIRHAARRGDPRAKLTLKRYDAERQREREAADAERLEAYRASGHSVTAGRQLYQDTH